MHRLRFGSLLILFLLCNGTACTPDFDEIWQVKDLRILALRADPPEVLVASSAIPPPPVHLTALVVDPSAPEEPVEWQLWACSAEKSNCLEAKAQELVKADQTRPDHIAADFVLGPELLKAALQADPLKGFGGVPVMIDLSVSRGGFSARGVKRLVYGTFSPPEKKPNRNPSIALGMGLFPNVVDIAAGETMTFNPQSPEEDKEKYLVATFSGGSRELTEYLSYSFFATSGKFSDATTGGKPSPFITNKKVTDLTSHWTSAIPAQDATIWIVVRDDRGGSGWIAGTVRVK
jgi:hypothetical protein